ncbi:HNH endonuclease [Bengtsoniella intestinalis]|uniref:HNH endonuclease n=1 Tax=Bengtsoniella intestinalis TaxID=3073143 RepID=UPI00391FC673
MIKLVKGEKPQELTDNAEKWTKEYCDCLAKGVKPSEGLAKRYNSPAIRKALEKETFEKCAYCESKVKHNSYGDVEHILPKRKDARPDLYVEWSNLTIACEICNRSGKKSYYNADLPLINPYEDDPSQVLQDVGNFIFPIIGNRRAEISEKILKLNRAELIERREDRIRHIESLLQSWDKEDNMDMKKVLLQELHEESKEEKEFSSTVKAFLTIRGLPPLR